MNSSKSRILLAVVFSLSSEFAAASCPAGTTPVTTATQFINSLNSGSGNYCLDQDIDLTPYSNFTPFPSFSGTLDGNGHVINGLKMSSSSQYVGLFRILNSGAQVKNLALTNASIEASSSDFVYVGMIAGWNDGGIISSVYVSGSVSTVATNTQHVGGVVGDNSGTISSAFADVTVVAGPSGGDNGAYTFGGLVGSNHGTITSSLASGAVSGGYGDGGGLAGYNNGTISQSVATGQALGSVGGPPGDDTSVIGGLAGWNQGGTIGQSYASATADGGANGAAAGLVELDDVGGSIDESYSVGRVTAGLSARGLVRSIGFGGGSVTDSYWDIDTSGQSTSAGGTGLHTSQFKQGLPAGFDPSIWSNGGGTSYPYLNNSQIQKSVVPTTIYGFEPGIVPIPIQSRTARFWSPLAQWPIVTPTSVPSKIYTIQPIGQKEFFQYLAYPSNSTDGAGRDARKHWYTLAREACGATVYAMLGRLVGAILPDLMVTYPVDDPPNSVAVPSYAPPVRASTAPIDYFLLHSKNSDHEGLATPKNLISHISFTPDVTKCGLPKPKKSCMPGQIFPAFDIGASSRVMNGNLLILHGRTVGKSGNAGFEHWILVTSVMKSMPGDGTGVTPGTVSRLVANDPETGQQIFIDVVQRINGKANKSFGYAVLSSTGATGADAIDCNNVQSYCAHFGYNFIADAYAYGTISASSPGPTVLFSDDFNRPNGVVGNGWSDTSGNVSYNLTIQNGAVSTPGPSGRAGIYRSIDLSGTITASMDLTHENGFGGLLNRYGGSELIFGNDGTLTGGYGVAFTRGDQNFSDSAVRLFLDGQPLAAIFSTFQFGAQIHVTVTLAPNGDVSGVVTGDGNTFTFDFGPRSVQLPGSNFAIVLEGADSRSSVLTEPTADNLVIIKD